MGPRVDQHLADILESITDAFLSVDSQWRFTYLNQQAEALLGTTREALLGRNMWEIFPAHPDSLNFHQALDQHSSLTYTAFYPSFNKWFTVRLFPSQQGLSAIFQDITERTQWEGKLEESEKRFRALIENCSDGIALVNTEGALLYASPSIVRITGFTPEELLAKNGFDRVHPDDLHLVRELFRHLLEKHGTSLSAPFRYQHKDGSWHWIEGTATNLLNDLQAVVFNFRDIMDRKQAEEQLQFYAHFAQSISDAVISGDMHYCILSWNDAAERLYGWKREEVLGKHSSDILSTSFPDPSGSDWLAHVFTEGFWKGEVSHKRKDGTSLTILASVSAVKDFSGSIIGFVTVNRDITASKQAMEQLRQSEQRFRLLAEHAPDIIARFDRELRHLYVNPATVKVTGIPVEVYVGKTNRELGMPADLIASWDIYLRKVFETGQQQTLEFAFPSPIGVKHYQTLVVPEYDTHGSIMSVLCVSRDVTDLKQLQERVWKSEQQLQAIIDGSTALIYLTDMQGRYLLINSQYEKLFHVTKKQIVGKTAADLFPKEIADTFQAHDQEVLQVGTERAWEEGIPQDDGLHIYLSVKFPLFDPTGVPYAVCGISTDITERKELEKRAVQDCGIGIAREHQAKIFERFYRVGSTTDNTFPGLGMGLYISHEIVQQHGGSIWVNSAAGKGSTFSFSLPLRAKG